MFSNTPSFNNPNTTPQSGGGMDKTTELIKKLESIIVKNAEDINAKISMVNTRLEALEKVYSNLENQRKNDLATMMSSFMTITNSVTQMLHSNSPSNASINPQMLQSLLQQPNPAEMQLSMQMGQLSTQQAMLQRHIQMQQQQQANVLQQMKQLNMGHPQNLLLPQQISLQPQMINLIPMRPAQLPNVRPIISTNGVVQSTNNSIPFTPSTYTTSQTAMKSETSAENQMKTNALPSSALTSVADQTTVKPENSGTIDQSKNKTLPFFAPASGTNQTTTKFANTGFVDSPKANSTPISIPTSAFNQIVEKSEAGMPKEVGKESPKQLFGINTVGKESPKQLFSINNVGKESPKPLSTISSIDVKQSTTTPVTPQTSMFKIPQKEDLPKTSPTINFKIPTTETSNQSPFNFRPPAPVQAEPVKNVTSTPVSSLSFSNNMKNPFGPKPVVSDSTAGITSSTETTTVKQTGGLFGNLSTQRGLFGQKPNQGSIFGATSTQNQSFSFGGSQSKDSMFGKGTTQSSIFGANKSTGSLFGDGSTQNKNSVLDGGNNKAQTPQKTESASFIADKDNEEIVYEGNCQMFIYLDGLITERGYGTIRVLCNPSKKSSRVVMRTNDDHKICANCPITKGMQLVDKPGRENVGLLNSVDFSEKSNGSRQVNLFKFENGESYFKFKTVFNKMCQQ